MIKVTQVCKDYPSERGGYSRVLSDVTFDLTRGEKIAVLGRNGAGKSTLIRLLGGIELPSSGAIERHMSISWPVALAGGIHGVLTGNDNIRFIARVYGKPFRELRDHVDDIAQLGKFLSEPVKTYSTGMAGRLNFALSLAVDFDCYLIDEVIAAGDHNFQVRCHQELFDKRADRALILASHVPEIVKNYCSRALVLHRGRAKIFDDLGLALEIYSAL
ncbi:MAG TPA: ABC transporter ATP-binding protein [Stellaceae bacterium]|jgi:capsular polysaccharide transport system ATP-binding protein|nr:ABC transporter ATP-binding protein [Stellaceae bacterium]